MKCCILIGLILLFATSAVALCPAPYKGYEANYNYSYRKYEQVMKRFLAHRNPSRIPLAGKVPPVKALPKVVTIIKK